MKITTADLTWASEQGIITSAQATELTEALRKKYEHEPHFGLGHTIYYLGALIVISSMSWFMVSAWESLGGSGIFLISLMYAAGFGLLGWRLWKRAELHVPGGLLFTAAVSMTPLAVYGFQRMMGWWPQGDPGSYPGYHTWVKSSWLFMEIATVLVGLLTLRKIRFPFITFPIAATLFYMSMDLTPLFFHKEDFTWDERKWVSLIFGFIMIGVTYVVDRRTKEDFAFWGYLFGLLAFWGGLTAMNSDSELGKFIYCLINLYLIFLSVFLSRKVFSVFGALGVFLYIGHLAGTVFKNSLSFPFALSLLGLGVIYLGIQYQKNHARIESWVLNTLPATLRSLRPTERR